MERDQWKAFITIRVNDCRLDQGRSHEKESEFGYICHVKQFTRFLAIGRAPLCSVLQKQASVRFGLDTGTNTWTQEIKITWMLWSKREAVLFLWGLAQWSISPPAPAHFPGLFFPPTSFSIWYQRPLAVPLPEPLVPLHQVQLCVPINSEPSILPIEIYYLEQNMHLQSEDLAVIPDSMTLAKLFKLFAPQFSNQ